MSSETKKVSVSPGVFSKLGVDFRARTIEARMYTIKLGSLASQAMMARTIGRAVASVKDVVVRRGLDRKLLETRGGRAFAAEVFASVAKRLGASTETVNKIRSLAESTSNAREFYRGLSEALKDRLDILKAGRGVFTAILMKTPVAKGDGKLVIVDTATAKAYVVGEKEVNEIAISRETLEKRLRESGLSNEEIERILKNERATKTKMLEILAGELKNMGFKVPKTFVADAVLSDLIRESFIEAYVTGAKPGDVFEAKLRAELSNNPVFAKHFEEKAVVELKRSLNVGAAMEAFDRVLAEMSSAMPRIALKILGAVLRYIPVVGVVASATAESAEMVTAVGEGVKKTVEKIGKNVVKISSKLNEVLPASTVEEMAIKLTPPSSTSEKQATATVSSTPSPVATTG